MLKPIVSNITHCKCCGGAASPYGVVDFSKNCSELTAAPFAVSGIPIYYYKCAHCDFIFTTAFDNFSHKDFVTHIYNQDYVLVDPEYAQIRPSRTAENVAGMFGEYRSLSILDYGGGNGTFAKMMKAYGFQCVDTYDPFSAEFLTRPSRQYDLVISIEVAEHTVDPKATFEELTSFVSPEGMALFTTVIQPQDMANIGVNWNYISPRNGHVSIYSGNTLKKLADSLGFFFGSGHENTHILCRQIPQFARHLLGRT
ncbi:class I SAM-dependent methyltransferase [Geobacter sp. DSM 9736]|uniref:class I SAM-dependent methyltransferase n=1 Tax=Geobacter sp. DSM 9736 TaxID=1277350 RepID=UPI000B50738E|nr:class I SAM-dependent methyltransferase [Geobacter sp. DSM 9736]SNB46982.1 2-polyprenyl-6-hydroxyphenyl methylase / 3-demethylubiquinone-9 3-methyltransferase [Geobacter sp. DSM 9736]